MSAPDAAPAPVIPVEDPPPVVLGLRGWPALYTLVLVGLAGCVALLYTLTRLYR